MGNSINSQNQRCYVKVETDFATIPSISGANACRIIKLATDQDQALIDRPDKLPTLDYTIGAGGRKSANWNASMSLAGSGSTAVPDMSPFLVGLFGKAPTGRTYTCEDASPTLSIFNYRTSAAGTNTGVAQQIAFGSVVKQAKFNFGQDVATVEFNGQSYWVIDSNQFATADTAAKGGLSDFPDEPGTPVTNGNMVIGFTGLVTLDGNVYGTFRTGSITFDTGRELPLDVFNAYYGDTPAQDRRSVTCEFNIYDDDTSELGSLKQKAVDKTPMTLVFQLGTVTHNKWTFTLNNVLLAAPKYDDSARKFAVTFTGKAYATNATSKDAIQLAIS